MSKQHKIILASKAGPQGGGVSMVAYFAGNQRIMNDYALLLRKNGVFQNRFTHNVSLIAVKLGVPYKIHRWVKYCLTSRFSEVRN